MTPDWIAIQSSPGFAGIQAIVERELKPALEATPKETLDKAGAPKALSRWMSVAFAMAVVAFLSTFLFLPDTWWGTLLRFILFPVIFLGSFALVAFLKRRSIITFLLRTETRLAIRTKALRGVAEHLGVEYVPMPGGLPKSVAMFASSRWAPAELRALADRLRQHGGMDEPLAVARASGLMQINVTVLGSEETRQKYREQLAGSQEIEDGFRGARSGVPFDMFEWVERVEDSPSIHHLIIVMTAPIRLNGVTQLRARAIPWLQTPNGVQFESVALEATEFEKHYRLRASDQIESRALFNPAVIERVLALAHHGKFRAEASGNHLVFAFQGTDRFALLDLQTGSWSDETIRKGLADLAEALALVDALAHAFMIRAQN